MALKITRQQQHKVLEFAVQHNRQKDKVHRCCISTWGILIEGKKTRFCMWCSVLLFDPIYFAAIKQFALPKTKLFLAWRSPVFYPSDHIKLSGKLNFFLMHHLPFKPTLLGFNCIFITGHHWLSFSIICLSWTPARLFRQNT